MVHRSVAPRIVGRRVAAVWNAVAIAVAFVAVGNAVAVPIPPVLAAPEPSFTRVVAARQVHPGPGAGIGVVPAIMLVEVGVAAVGVVGVGALLDDERQRRRSEACANADPGAATRRCDHTGAQQQRGQWCGQWCGDR